MNRAIVSRLIIFVWLLQILPLYVQPIDAANAYSGGMFDISTSCGVAGASGLNAIKGSFCAVTDTIYVDSGATLTVDSALSCLKIYLGQSKAGAVGAGQRYGILTVNAGMTITFGGNSTNTNSGIQSNPTTADASSLNCVLNVLGTAASPAVFTNDGNANDANKKYTVNMLYGSLNIDYLNANFAYGNVFAAVAINSTRAAAGSVAKHIVLSTSAASQDLFVSTLATIDLAHDLRFNTMDITANANFRIAVFSAADFASGGSVDISGFATKGTPSPADFTPMVLEGSVCYAGQCKASYLDIRPTTVIPTSLTLTNLSDGTVKAKITNIGDYSATDEIVVYDSSNNARACISKARYVASTDRKPDSCLIIPGVPLQSLTKWYAKATSDNSNFSASSDTAARVTPTLLPAAGNILTGFGAGQSSAEITGTLTLPTRANVKSGTTYGGGGTDSTGTLSTTGGSTRMRKASFKNY
jgi:hypothetical protein